MRRSGGRLREQVCGGGRRRLGRVRPHRLAGQPEVSEDLLHDSGILDRRQQAHPVPPPGTREHVDVGGVLLFVNRIGSAFTRTPIWQKGPTL